MSRNSMWFAVACAFVLLSTGAARADDEDNIGTLGRIQTHTLVLAAKYKEQQAQALLDGTVRPDGTGGISAPATNQVDSTPPNVKLIVNGDGGPSATFIYAGGAEAGGRVGSKIPGGYTIKSMSIANRSVDVADRKGKLITLPMSSSAPTAPAPQPSTPQFGGFGAPSRPMFATGGAPMPRMIH